MTAADNHLMDCQLLYTPSNRGMGLTIGGRQVMLMPGYQLHSSLPFAQICSTRLLTESVDTKAFNCHPTAAKNMIFHVLLCAFSIGPYGMAVNFTGYNATLTAGCINAGCTISALPTNTTANNASIAEIGAWYVPGWAQCQPNRAEIARQNYPNPKDAALTYAYGVCSSSGIQWDQSLCNSAKL